MSLEIALAQAALGRSVFPVLDKRPLVKWTAEATTKSRRIHSWWQAWPTAGAGWAIPIGYVVLDIDDPQAFKDADPGELPPAPGQYTTRGVHLLYAVPAGIEIKQGPIPGGDLKVGGKGYVKLYSVDSFTRAFDVRYVGSEGKR